MGRKERGGKEKSRRMTAMREKREKCKKGMKEGKKGEREGGKHKKEELKYECEITFLYIISQTV
jgi:hypothetical protein